MSDIRFVPTWARERLGGITPHAHLGDERE
jgi:hypothetical protein